MNNWYIANTGNEQGLIIEENTGRNIAVTYDEKDAVLVASIPELIKTLQDIRRYLQYPIETKSDRMFVTDRINEVLFGLEG